MNFELHNDDCLIKMKEFPDNHFDSVVTDPPYGLSFMGKKWDQQVPGPGPEFSEFVKKQKTMRIEDVPE